MLWNYLTKKPLRTFQGHISEKFCLQVRAEGEIGNRKAWKKRATATLGVCWIITHIRL